MTEYQLFVPKSLYRSLWKWAKDGGKHIRIEKRKLFWYGFRVINQNKIWYGIDKSGVKRNQTE